MVELILFGLVVALSFGVIVSGVAAGLAWFAGLLFPKAYEPTLALVTAGFVPVGLLVWSIIGFAGSGCWHRSACHFYGPPLFRDDLDSG